MKYMQIKITYPHIEKHRVLHEKMMNLIKSLILLTAVICPIVNIAAGGKAWSIIVLMSLYMVYTMTLSPALIEYNRISQFIKFVGCLCVLLTLIDSLLAPGWSIIAVSVILCCGLSVSGILLFTDLEKQKHNMFPIILLIAIGIIRAIIGVCFYHGGNRIASIIMGIFALVLLILCIIALRSDFVRELRCRFHVR